MFRYFGYKGKCLKAAGMYSFEVTGNKKTPSGVKRSALQNGYLKFYIFFYFDPETKNFDFSKNNNYKIQNFGVTPKPEYML